MAIREGRWDCQYCSSKGVLGRHKACPVCTAPRERGTKFYLPQDAQVIEDSDLLGYAKMGPDWICAYCNTNNPAKNRHCSSCTNLREEDSGAQAVKDYKLGMAPTSGDMTFEEEEAEPEPVAATPQPKNRTPLLIGVGLVVLACIALAWFATRTTNTTAELQGYEWERTVEIQTLTTVTETGWDLPADGFLISESEEIRSYDDVIVGYTEEARQVSEEVYVGERTYVCGQRDLGNGFFEDIECSESIYDTEYSTVYDEVPIYEQVPVYDTEYTYEVDKWVTTRTESLTGSDQNSEWPQYVLESNEREGPRTEDYVAIFLDENGRTHRLEVPSFSQFSSFSNNQTYELELDSSGALMGLTGN
ncbi:MAG: Ran-binding zinc finger domain-containing protein [Anaerolineae bacterium]